MEDIVIKKHQIKRELLLLGVCIAVAEALNIYAIAHYGGRWTEVFMSLIGICVCGWTVFVCYPCFLQVTVCGIIPFIPFGEIKR